MPSIMASLSPRQTCLLDADGFIDESTCYVPFWYTKTGHIVKWSIFLALIGSIILYMLIGYIHAKRRLRKNLAPLPYHRFLVSRAHYPRDQRWPQATPYYQNGPGGGGPGAYGMYNMAPPPVYDPNSARPPMYPGPPPEGGSKVDPGQAAGGIPVEPSPSYPGPPPPAQQQQQASGVTTGAEGNNNPYRL